MTSFPKILLFDLGGVVVPWVGLDRLAEREGSSRDAVAARFARSEIFNAYERGQVSNAAFTTELVRLFDLPDTDIAALWNGWVEPPYPGVLSALSELKTRFTTACLSNTNDLHWAHLNTMFETSVVFHHAFASHQIREAKPDAQSYLTPLARMGVEAEDVWFFDDTQLNVEAARHVGMTAFEVDRTVGVLPTLRELGLVV